MSNYQSFKLFATDVVEEMESLDDCSIHMDERMLEQTNNRQVGFQRDDLYRFMLVLPHEESWMPSKLYAYVPEEIDTIADRPRVPVVEIESIEVSKVIGVVRDKAPEYSGKFEYDD